MASASALLWLLICAWAETAKPKIKPAKKKTCYLFDIAYSK